MFDEPKPYAVFRYVLDAKGESTEHAGQIVAFVKSTDPWQAVEDAGFDDMDLYGANMVDPETYDKLQDSINEERELLDKVEAQLKEFIDERNAEIEKFKEERPCPNCGTKMDNQYRCPECSFGHEKRELLDNIKEQIKEAKKNGGNTDDLKELKKALETAIKQEDELAKE